MIDQRIETDAASNPGNSGRAPATSVDEADRRGDCWIDPRWYRVGVRGADQHRGIRAAALLRDGGAAWRARRRGEDVPLRRVTAFTGVAKRIGAPAICSNRACRQGAVFARERHDLVAGRFGDAEPRRLGPDADRGLRSHVRDDGPLWDQQWLDVIVRIGDSSRPLCCSSGLRCVIGFPRRRTSRAHLFSAGGR